MAKPFEIMDEDKRIVAGWASVEIVDSHGDIIPIEELKRGMITLMDRGGQILYGHTNKPVGKILAWEIKKHDEVDASGLWIIAKIYKEYPLDDEVWRLIKEGRLRGFSIGAQGRKEKMLLKDKSKDLPQEVNIVRDLNLLEISIVPTPANPLATIEQVNYIAKSANEEQKKFIDLEEVLRKYELKKEELDTVEGCPLCEEIKSIINDVGGDVDLGLKIWRALDLKKREKFIEKLSRLNELADNVLKSIEELKEYEDALIEERIERIEGTSHPVDDFAERLEYYLEELQKSIVDILKPFGKWESFDDCVKDMKDRGYGEYSAERICGSLQAKLEKQEGNAHHYKAAIECLRSAVEALREGGEQYEPLRMAVDAILTAFEMLEEEPEIMKDKRPPKKWFDRCVERTGSEALCGWVFYHHLEPKKPESKREPDEPHTVEARARKRKWLEG